MRLDLENLPRDTALLHRLVRDMAGLVEHRDDEISRLQQIIKQLQRTQYGRRSERLDPDQLALGLEDLDADIAQIIESRPAPLVTEPLPARRKALPEHLEREEQLLDVEGEDCARCGGTLHPIGESVSEMLDWVPATLRVIRIRRPKYACRKCETVAQAPAPERVIAGGLATPALLSHVLISKYCDHLPLYRQSQMFARQGVELERSTLAGWVGGACWWLDALHDSLGKTSSPPIICSPMIRRYRCLIRGGGAPRPGDYGFTRATSGAGLAPILLQPYIITNPIAERSGRRIISRTIKAHCMSTAMPGSSS